MTDLDEPKQPLREPTVTASARSVIADQGGWLVVPGRASVIRLLVCLLLLFLAFLLFLSSTGSSTGHGCASDSSTLAGGSWCPSSSSSSSFSSRWRQWLPERLFRMGGGRLSASQVCAFANAENITTALYTAQQWPHFHFWFAIWGHSATELDPLNAQMLSGDRVIHVIPARGSSHAQGWELAYHAMQNDATVHCEFFFAMDDDLEWFLSDVGQLHYQDNQSGSHVLTDAILDHLNEYRPAVTVFPWPWGDTWHPQLAAMNQKYAGSLQQPVTAFDNGCLIFHRSVVDFYIPIHLGGGFKPKFIVQHAFQNYFTAFLFRGNAIRYNGVAYRNPANVRHPYDEPFQYFKFLLSASKCTHGRWGPHLKPTDVTWSVERGHPPYHQWHDLYLLATFFPITQSAIRQHPAIIKVHGTNDELYELIDNQVNAILSPDGYCTEQGLRLVRSTDMSSFPSKTVENHEAPVDAALTSYPHFYYRAQISKSAGFSSQSKLESYGPLPKSLINQVTAVTLHWRRTSQVQVVVQQLIRTGIFDEIIVWNNNPSMNLTEELLNLESYDPTKVKVRLINDGKNYKDEAKYLACRAASHPICYYQDDDWDTSDYVRSLLHAYEHAPDRLHIVSEPYTVMTNSEWSFRVPQLGLNTGFSWIGCGAVFKKSHAIGLLELLDRFTAQDPGLRTIADVFFAIWMNQMPFGYSVAIRKFPEENHENAFSSQQGFFDLQRRASETAIRTLYEELKKENSPFPISDQNTERHTWSFCPGDQCVFLTNMGQPMQGVLFDPAVDSMDRATRNHLPHLDDIMEAMQSTYFAAVDDEVDTCWQSEGVAQMGSYFGMELTQPEELDFITLVFDHSWSLHRALQLEVSMDGEYYIRIPVENLRISTTHLYNNADPSQPKEDRGRKHTELSSEMADEGVEDRGFKWIDYSFQTGRHRYRFIRFVVGSPADHDNDDDGAREWERFTICDFRVHYRESQTGVDGPRT